MQKIENSHAMSAIPMEKRLLFHTLLLNANGGYHHITTMNWRLGPKFGWVFMKVFTVAYA